MWGGKQDIHAGPSGGLDASQMDAIWSTLIATDSIGSPRSRQDRKEMYNMYTHVVNCEAETSETPASNPQPEVNCTRLFDDISRTISSSLFGPHRKFFISTKGYFGLGPPHCAESDVVCIFRNFSMPAVLRRCKDFSIYVGTAYVHGIMRGEESPVHDGVPGSDDGLELFTLR